MGQYRVNRKMRKHKKLAVNGRIVSSTRFNVGDIVEWDDTDAARFVKSGTFSPVADGEETESDDGGNVEPDVSDSDGQGSPEATDEEPAETAGESVQPQGSPSDDSGDVIVQPADYSEWDYHALQAEAKQFGIPANQSKADIITDLEALDKDALETL